MARYKSTKISGEEWRRLFAQFVRECLNELPPDKGFHVSREALRACIKRKIAEYKQRLAGKAI